MKNFILILTLFTYSIFYAQETVTFLSGDELINVTADVYINDINSEFILLCHQAGYSRGEYIETAPTLVGLGYNCMATDQRSGNTINDVNNETHAAAVAEGLSTGYTDAIPDIEAAIDYAYELNGNNPIFLLGSSYSSSIALILGKDNPKVKATLAFSPAENLSGYNVSELISDYAKPMFVTSAQSEIGTVTDLIVDVDPDYVTHFQPTVAGIHGSRNLWTTTIGHEQYWEAMEAFLAAVPSALHTSENNILSFSVFPNPTNGIISINSKETIEKIEIIDLLGRVIITTENANKIDLTDQKQGAYIMKVYTKNSVGARKVMLK